jgi:hypothetical protein
MNIFFKERIVHNIYFLISVSLTLIGFLISSISSNRELVFGVGKVLLNAFGILDILLLVLYMLPHKVFIVWQYVSIPFLIFVLIETIKNPIFKTCVVFNCDRYAIAGFYTLLSVIISLLVAVLIATSYHFWLKHKQKIQSR